MPASISTTAYTGRFVPPSPQEVAARLPHLEVHELLGAGGMGVVYKGRQPLLDRAVAIKVIRPDIREDERARDRFLREARTAAKLLHPYIVTVFDVGRAGDLDYLVMEYVEGTSLRTLLARRSVTARDVLDYVPQMAEALEHAHDAGVVHRDVKPENVLIDRRGRVRLVDFGLATLNGPGKAPGPDDHRAAGTLPYMAPEQLNAPETVDHRADIYSTGVVFYELLTGELPGLERRPPSARAQTDPRLDPVVLRAMERERERRYQAARNLRQDVLAVSRTPDSTAVIERLIAAPIEQVYAAWLNPDEMHDWYAPTDDYTTPVAEVDPRVGGTYRVAMKHKDREQPHVVSGQYCRMEPPYALVFTWAWEAPKPCVVETQVTVEFEPRGDATNVVLTHERFRDKGQLEGHAEGWTGCLSRLERKLTR